MKKIWASITKESLVLRRDIEGVLLIFLMPVLLVVVIALLQHRTFQSVMESKIPVIVVDHDNDSLGVAFRDGLKASAMFELTEVLDTDSSALEKARQAVAEGQFQMGVYIPAKSTKKIKNRAVGLVRKQLPNSVKVAGNAESQASVQLFFDPTTKESFKGLIKRSMAEFAAKTESKIIFLTYVKVVDALTNRSSQIEYPKESIIRFEEDTVSEYTSGIIPNAVQHNVPAWTLFGMFLICIPIAGNIIKERNDGCLARLKTVPVSFFELLMGKVVVYISVLMLQAVLIILVGIYLMPHIGLPKLQLSGNYASLFLMSLASALAAAGYGIAVGTVAKTQVQAATFGSISTVILAAIGGVWIPVMVMPDFMRRLSALSPMNWGIKGYYDVFLRSASVTEVLPSVLKLLVFFGVSVLVSVVFRKYQD